MIKGSQKYQNHTFKLTWPEKRFFLFPRYLCCVTFSGYEWRAGSKETYDEDWLSRGRCWLWGYLKSIFKRVNCRIVIEMDIPLSRIGLFSNIIRKSNGSQSDQLESSYSSWIKKQKPQVRIIRFSVTCCPTTNNSFPSKPLLILSSMMMMRIGWTGADADFEDLVRAAGHPLLQATYTGVRTTVPGNIFFPSFLAKTKR